MIRHSVHLRVQKGVEQAKLDDVYARLAALGDQLDGTLDFQHRKNLSPETSVVHGFLDMFWFDFTDETARDAYLVHPTHQAIGADIVSCAEGGISGVFVCDVEI